MATRREYHGNIRAPEFPKGIEWLNTTQQLSLGAFRGKMVLLDFWTYGCINCMHILLDLKRLEQQYPNELVVIGVHSAKFANEADSANIKRIIARYEITHPVVNDRNMMIWQQYGIRAWPTTVLIDPQGRVLAAHSGEGVYAAYASLIREAIVQFKQDNTLRDDAPVILRSVQSSDRYLEFPGKVIIDAVKQALIISDSGHNRIVVAGLDGENRTIIGSGASALRDGDLDHAAFNKPQGLAVEGELIYIADTGNHALRCANLESRQVVTLAGDGQITYQILDGLAKRMRLNSPWDLWLRGGQLFIAMAGLHQIYIYDTIERTIRLYAGSGREVLADNKLLDAGFAQPSGLVSDDRTLYVADSEASAIRAVDLGANGEVRTLVGAGLFDFGDVDGARPVARLQHALGVALAGEKLYIADTYNHKIKLLNLASGAVSTLLGGKAGYQDGYSPAFYEPGGLTTYKGKLYIADTNNHAVRIANLETLEVSTLELHDSRPA
ncbi:MAG: redoxin domain-containing protein [Chloroflexi bacterium]|nr:redoxin domain-containing protein [Chloroflexota bacterium]